MTMRRPVCAAAAAALAALCFDQSAAAQTTSDQLARFAAGPYVGVARHSLVGTRLGVTPDRNHLFLGIHATLNIWRTSRVAVGYAPEIVPLLIVSNNPEYLTVTTGGGRRFTVDDGRRSSVAGFAVSPIGVEGQLRVARSWRVYVAGAAGAVWFTREVPVAGSRAFNYTFELGGGALWAMSRRDSLRVGYKFHHLSNAYTSPQNPGIDGAVILLGVERGFGSTVRRR